MILKLNQVICFRSSQQKFVWWSAETPVSVSNELHIRNEAFKAFDGFFNLTMTYRHDSGVYWGYGNRESLLKELPRGRSVVNSIMERKSNLAVSEL